VGLSPQSPPPGSAPDADGDWKAVEGVLNKNLAAISEYLKIRKGKFNTTETVSAVHHLNNKKAKRELKVNSTTKPCSFALNTPE